MPRPTHQDKVDAAYSTNKPCPQCGAKMPHTPGGFWCVQRAQRAGDLRKWESAQQQLAAKLATQPKWTENPLGWVRGMADGWSGWHLHLFGSDAPLATVCRCQDGSWEAEVFINGGVTLRVDSEEQAQAWCMYRIAKCLGVVEYSNI